MNRVLSSQRGAARSTATRAATRVKAPRKVAAARRAGPPRPWLADVRRHVSVGWLLAKLVAAVVLIAGFGAAGQIASASQFRIAEIVVMGNELVAAEDIAATINAGDSNAFAVRGRRTERILQADPAIENAAVRTRLPDRVEVTIHERVPAVVWEATGRTLLADARGVALRDGARDDLPVIHAPDGPAPETGGRVDPDAVRMAQSLAPRLEAEGLGGGQIEYRPSTGATIVLPDLVRVALGSADDLEDKLAAYRAIQAYLDRNRSHAQFIDVRFLERPYFR